MWPPLDHGLSQADLLIELERPRLYRQGPGGGAGLGEFVDEPRSHAELGQP